MPKQTIAESLIEGLLALGFVEAHPPRQSRRYHIFSDHKSANYVFVGQNGALRVGRSRTSSRSCSDAFRLMVLEAKSKALKSAFATL